MLLFTTRSGMEVRLREYEQEGLWKIGLFTKRPNREERRMSAMLVSYDTQNEAQAAIKEMAKEFNEKT